MIGLTGSLIAAVGSFFCKRCRLATRFLASRDDEAVQSQNKMTRWERFAQILLGSNEFMYLD